MDLFELYESTYSDLGYMRRAVAIYDGIFHYMQKNRRQLNGGFEQWKGNGQWGFSQDIGKMLNAMGKDGKPLEGFKLVLIPEHDKWAGGYSAKPNHTLYMCLLPSEPELVNWTAVLMQISAKREFIVHEVQHFFDHLRSPGDRNHKTINLDGDELYNHPKEFNAYYQQGLSRIMRYVDGTIYDDEKKQQIVPKNFNAFLRIVSKLFHPNFINHLNDVYSKKLTRRLYKLHSELVAKVWPMHESAQPYNNWSEHTAEQINAEYEFEWQRRFVKRAPEFQQLFPTVEDFWQAVKAAPVITLTPNLHIGNRTSARTLQDLVKIVHGYRMPRPVMKLAQAFQAGRPMAYPIVVKWHQRLSLLGGNTRANIADILGIVPKAKLLDLDALVADHADLDETATAGATGAASVATAVGAIGAGFNPNGDWGIYSKPAKKRREAIGKPVVIRRPL